MNYTITKRQQSVILSKNSRSRKLTDYSKRHCICCLANESVWAYPKKKRIDGSPYTPYQVWYKSKVEPSKVEKTRGITVHFCCSRCNAKIKYAQAKMIHDRRFEDWHRRRDALFKRMSKNSIANIRKRLEKQRKRNKKGQKF